MKLTLDASLIYIIGISALLPTSCAGFALPLNRSLSFNFERH